MDLQEASGSHLLGGAALASLLGQTFQQNALANGSIETHFPAKAKRVIYLHMVGGPSQMDLFDYKPEMAKWYDKDLPESIRQGQRLTTMTSGQARFPIAPSKWAFAQKGNCGMWMNDELLPHLAQRARVVVPASVGPRPDLPEEPVDAARQEGLVLHVDHPREGLLGGRERGCARKCGGLCEGV